MFRFKLGKKGQVLKFVVGLIITIFVFFYSFKGLAELAKVGVGSTEKGNFNELVDEIKKLAEEGEDGSRANLELNLGTSLKDRVIINFWNDGKEKYSRCAKSQQENWYRPDQCKGKDCLCFFMSHKSENKGTSSFCGSKLKLREFHAKEFSCFEYPDNYYVYFLNNFWNNFGNSPGRFKVGLYKLGNIIFVCKDECTWPKLINIHPKKHLNNNVGGLAEEIKKLSLNGTEGEKRNFKLNLGYNKAIVHYPNDPERKPINYGCSEKFEKKLLYYIKTQETADLGFGQNTICAVSTFKTESTSQKGNVCGSEKPIIHLTPKGGVNTILECHSMGDVKLKTKNMHAWNSFDQKPFTMTMALEKKGDEILLCKGASC